MIITLVFLKKAESQRLKIVSFGMKKDLGYPSNFYIEKKANKCG